MLFDPATHGRVTDRSWDAGRVRDAIAAVAVETEGAFDEIMLWPPHPLDLDGGPLPSVASL
jgi:hypothetical protein